jgi:uncharacterized protein YndB with AHSA1/START domain
MKPRAFEASLEMAASPETIWKALTDPASLTQWFATEADIELRPGGRFAISWNGDWPWTMSVVECEPGVRLRLRDAKARPFDAEGRPLGESDTVELALEFHLAPTDGGTVVRVVHSGFGHGEGWDDEFDGISTGWLVELRVLRHYVERCFGRARRMAWVRATSDATPEALWARLAAPDALLRDSAVLDAPTGTRARARFGSGDVLEGPVLFGAAKRNLLLQAENAGDGLLNIAVHRAGGRSMAQVVLSTWAQPAEELAAFERRVQARLDAIV